MEKQTMGPLLHCKNLALIGDDYSYRILKIIRLSQKVKKLFFLWLFAPHDKIWQDQVQACHATCKIFH